MKTKLTLLICALALLVASCGSLQSFEKRKYRPGFYVSVADNKQQTELLSNDKEEKQTEVKETNTDTVPVKKDSVKILVISDMVGDVIDSAEKAKYKLFPYWDNDKFLSAQFVQEADGQIFLVGKMRSGAIGRIPYSNSSYNQLAKLTFKESSTTATESKKTDAESAYKSARIAKTSALLALLFAFLTSIMWLTSIPEFGFILFPALSLLLSACFLIFGLIAFVKGRREKMKHLKGEDYVEKHDAMYGYIAGWCTIILFIPFIMFISYILFVDTGF